jgi:BlaI family transcriptional regulator, penicillinase repressor
MRHPNPVLTEQELEIMKIIWRLGDVTVRQVYEEILKERKIAYTTVMTMMGILEEKKFLKKTSTEKAHVYRPAQAKAQVMSRMVKDFVERVFNGSAKPLLVHLVETEQVTPEELAELTAMVKRSKS